MASAAAAFTAKQTPALLSLRVWSSPSARTQSSVPSEPSLTCTITWCGIDELRRIDSTHRRR